MNISPPGAQGSLGLDAEGQPASGKSLLLLDLNKAFISPHRQGKGRQDREYLNHHSARYNIQINESVS